MIKYFRCNCASSLEKVYSMFLHKETWQLETKIVLSTFGLLNSSLGVSSTYAMREVFFIGCILLYQRIRKPCTYLHTWNNFFLSIIIVTYDLNAQKNRLKFLNTILHVLLKRTTRNILQSWKLILLNHYSEELFFR